MVSSLYATASLVTPRVLPDTINYGLGFVLFSFCYHGRSLASSCASTVNESKSRLNWYHAAVQGQPVLPALRAGAVCLKGLGEELLRRIRKCEHVSQSTFLHGWRKTRAQCASRAWGSGAFAALAIAGVFASLRDCAGGGCAYAVCLEGMSEMRLQRVRVRGQVYVQRSLIETSPSLSGKCNRFD